MPPANTKFAFVSIDKIYVSHLLKLKSGADCATPYTSGKTAVLGQERYASAIY